MKDFIVLLDSCVLYPAPLRSLFMYLAVTDLFQARWTLSIHEEWMRSVRNDYPDITQAKLERVRGLMNSHVRNCLVEDYESLIPSLTLPDPDDRHVLAAAIRGGANLIVTFNLRDFPKEVLTPFGIEAQHPDDFVSHLLNQAPAIVCAAVKRQRESLKAPPKTVAEFLDILARQSLPQTAAQLAAVAELI